MDAHLEKSDLDVVSIAVDERRLRFTVDRSIPLLGNLGKIHVVRTRFDLGLVVDE